MKNIITKEIEIDMGHRVPNHKSKCRNIHGHRYKIEVGVRGEIITTQGASDEGMIIDFGDLKQIMVSEIDEKYDHGFACFENDPEELILNSLKELRDKGMKIIFTDFIPTAENLAKHWFEIIKPRLEEKRIALEYVRVFETPTSTATYSNE